MFGFLKKFFDFSWGHDEQDVKATYERALANARQNDGQALDFQSAIAAHMKWRERLESLVAGESEEKLDAGTVGKDHACVLGQWIHSEATLPYRDWPDFKNLVGLHATFHACAARVIVHAQKGELDEARAILVRGGEYQTVSRHVITLLARLNNELHRRSAAVEAGAPA